MHKDKIFDLNNLLCKKVSFSVIFLFNESKKEKNSVRKIILLRLETLLDYFSLKCFEIKFLFQNSIQICFFQEW